MSGYSIIEQIVNFLTELIQSFSNGYLFFGSVWDVIRSICDIFIVMLLVYWVLLFIRRSRAWQLVKGIVLILLFVIACSFLGLDMVGFIFNKFLYVFAILFIVIFQPELRRALETVGLKSFGSIKGLLTNSEYAIDVETSSLIDEITDACSEMSSTYTGALILIERNSRLDELLNQENVVRFDSSVTSSVLQSIFYKGSPMHDGALLIRDGKIIAARCHVPLSVTMQHLQRTGTRHRAAVGASELGDTIAIAVSEERGKTSIAVNGRLFEMKDKAEIKENLSYLLGLSDQNENKSKVSSFFDGIKSKFGKKKETDASKTKAPAVKVAAALLNPKKTDVASDSNNLANDKSKRRHTTLSEKAVLLIISVVISLCLWMYIQINNNPVVSTTVTVPISYNSSMPANMDVSYPIDTVEIVIVGRQDTINNLQTGDIIATIDYSGVSEPGVVELPVVIEPGSSNIYFRVEQQIPETVSVTVYGGDEG